MNNEKFTVFSIYKANELANLGFEIIGTGINVKNPKYKVFFFENTPEFQEAFKKLH